MNTKQLELLIERCVRRVIKDELSEILKEAILKNSKTQELFEYNENTGGKTITFPTFTTNNITPTNNKKRLDEMYGNNVETKTKNTQLNNNEEKSNPYIKFFAQTAAEMTPQDKANLRQLD